MTAPPVEGGPGRGREHGNSFDGAKGSSSLQTIASAASHWRPLRPCCRLDHGSVGRQDAQSLMPAA